MSSFFSNLGSFLRLEAKKAEQELGKLWAGMKPLVVAGEQELAAVAMNAVMTQIPLVLGGSVKLANATASIVTSLGQQGKTIALHLAEAAAQAAYNEIQSLRPAAGP